MITGAILENGESGYTYLKKMFRTMDDFQRDYNWLITDCEAYPKDPNIATIFQQKYNSYALISGEELTDFVNKDDFQWIWAVLSGFEKSISKSDILKFELPYANGYKGFWAENITMQHPLSSIELVAWDSSCTLLISRHLSIIKKFRKIYPLSEDLKRYNVKNKMVG